MFYVIEQNTPTELNMFIIKKPLKVPAMLDTFIPGIPETFYLINSFVWTVLEFCF